MRHHWTLAAVLSSALAVGCSDRPAENLQESAENTALPAGEGIPSDAAPATPEASPRGDESTARNQTGTTNRPAASAPATRPRTPANGGSGTVVAESRPAAPRVETREVTIPAGTALPLELVTAMSSESAAVETPVRATLREAVSVDGYTVLPAGAVLHGNVTEVARAGRVQGRSRLAFRFSEVEIAGGREDLQTNLLAFEGEATRGEDATKIGAGAVGGAIIGGILGGGDGAAKGAVIGGAAGTGAVLATRGRDVSLASGTSLSASLAQPFTIRVRN